MQTYQRWAEDTAHCLEQFPRKARQGWINFARELDGFRGGGEKTAEVLRFTWGVYVALSYCWVGDARTPPCSIVLDGYHTPVTESLKSALRSQRPLGHDSDSSIPLRCWADALCINQADQAERERDILRMTEIYGNSLAVLVHIGPQADDSDLAMSLIEDIGRKHADGFDCETWLLKLRWDASVETKKAYSVLLKLFCRPYWRRLWVLQELAMSDETIGVGCGNKTVNLTYLAASTKFLCLNVEALFMLCGDNSILGPRR
ncbi:HET-domain-containing protein [Tothia fuscella]|uniref:HET-domain-containing protein n=1 Tax=Tothia fuscella TaxID=1048955 RepID=A0A9P4NPF8_9PEZI|nr:HET-domain-containing protein [Tothia fuscella]